MRRLSAFVVVVLLATAVAAPATAQYFGRNKVQYDDFEFKILPTERFDIYFYEEEREAVTDAARMAERWYRRHSRTFLREFREKKPIIFYANDADFHQTNVIQGTLGEGTGGVTEGLKQRVVMPLTGSYADTDHVLGHELVHSFQYDIAFSDADSVSFNLRLLPLWLVEGMAEYLSVGREDPHTAMWLRDAALREDLPTIEDLTTSGRYFPYRYGQSYMAYVGGKYGDGAVSNLYKLAGRVGVDSAFVYALGITTDSLSTEWQQVVRETYLPLMEGRTHPDSVGREVISEDGDGGTMNIAPSLSPDGQYIAFLSERDLFNINLFVADAQTGEVLKRLQSVNTDPHFDNLRFINSAGSWSPDGTRLAFITFVEGDNEIAILDVNRLDIVRRIRVEGVGAITNPVWSPDGTTIAFSGIDGGISDLYLLDVETNAVRQLTQDRYADLQPTWSPDGRTIAFATDRGEPTSFESLQYAPMRLGLIDVGTGDINLLIPFPEATHHNPQFSPDGRSLFFISDQDGFKDVYRLGLATNELFRVTNLQTGVSGISALSPAMSVADQSGRMAFSVFFDGAYDVHVLEASETQGVPVEGVSEGRVAAAGVLPPLRALNEGLVGNYLSDALTGLPAAESFGEVSDYSARLQLDYVAPPTIGASVGGPYGSRFGGGVGFFFSDMLGNHNLAVVAQANGTVRDIGGQVQYLNRENRLNWGGSAGHIPIAYGGAAYSIDPSSGGLVYQQRIYRYLISQAAGIASYPFSTTQRVEANLGVVRYGFAFEAEEYLLDNFGRVIGRNRRNLDELEPPPFYYVMGGLAYVGDYSLTGPTSPIVGGRYRIGVSPMTGTHTYLTATADYRRYLYAKPFTFAVRGLHIGNYGLTQSDLVGDDRSFFGREYLGAPYYQGFVRGYSFNSFEPSECTAPTPQASASRCLEDLLIGTRLAVASAEFRIPVLGIEDIALVTFPYLPIEVAPFVDAGVAWTAEEGPDLRFLTEQEDLFEAVQTQGRIPVVSAGVSTRVNLLGYMVFEMFYAYPFQRPEKGAHFGFQLVPGW